MADLRSLECGVVRGVVRAVAVGGADAVIQPEHAGDTLPLGLGHDRVDRVRQRRVVVAGHDHEGLAELAEQGGLHQWQHADRLPLQTGTGVGAARTARVHEPAAALDRPQQVVVVAHDVVAGRDIVLLVVPAHRRRSGITEDGDACSARAGQRAAEAELTTRDGGDDAVGVEPARRLERLHRGDAVGPVRRVRAANAAVAQFDQPLLEAHDVAVHLVR